MTGRSAQGLGDGVAGLEGEGAVVGVVDAGRGEERDGVDSDRDGVPDSTGVSDILLGLRTYSTSGN